MTALRTATLPLLRQGMLHLAVLKVLRMLRHSLSRTVHPAHKVWTCHDVDYNDFFGGGGPVY
jgi:hypothetical protein